MRFLSLFIKCLRENLRSRLMLLLVLLLAPLIIAIFYAASGGEAGAYRVAYLDQGRRAGGELVAALGAYAKASEVKLRVEPETELAAAKKKLAEGASDLLIVIPADFSESVRDASMGGPSKPRVEFYYDAESIKSASLFGIAYSLTTQYILAATGKELPFDIVENFVTPVATADPSSPDAFIPSFLILSILNVLFLAASTIVREVEQGTIKRLVLSRATSLDLVASISLAQLLISLACLALSLGTAYLFGYRPRGSPAGILLVGALSSLSMMAFSTITACFCRTVKDVWIVGNFPYMISLFFSGFIPLPTSELFKLGDRSMTINSFIPLSHGIKALDKLMNGEGTVGDIGFELVAIVALTAVYFAIGLVFFYRRRMRLA